MFTIGLGSQRIHTDIGVGTCFVHYLYVVFIMGLNNELAKYNDDTKLVCQSKQILVVNTEGVYNNIDQEGLKILAFES